MIEGVLFTVAILLAVMFGFTAGIVVFGKALVWYLREATPTRGAFYNTVKEFVERLDD